ncbi:hypothetical protein K3495_g11231 [Podosphaera aphanis]|nr:hypothetical protein K3495_g11231 [Podosphaera aphanis]
MERSNDQEIDDQSSAALISRQSKESGFKTFEPQKTFPLTEECRHYTQLREVEWDIQKYWKQRYDIFSLYDAGIYMTDDSWFGVTPEPVANRVAQDLARFASPEKRVLIDMFAGAGGNIIAFALSGRWERILALEKDASVISCAHNNASIYEVENQITWIHGDSFEYLASQAAAIDPKETVIFASPPWGGPGYQSSSIYDLEQMQPYSLREIYEASKNMDLALYLPRTSDLRQISRLVPDGKKIEVVQYCMDGASKAMVAYLPAFKP